MEAQFNRYSQIVPSFRKVAFMVLFVSVHTVSLYWLSQKALTFYPNTGDENSFLFQAKIFSKGHVSAKAPARPELFESDYIGSYNGKWFSTYPPGEALLLVLGVLAGYPLLSQFILSFTLVISLFFFLMASYRDRWTAFLATAIFYISPTFLFHSISFYSHIGAAAVFVAVLISVAKYEQAKDKRHIQYIGLLLGLGVLIRPYTFFLLSFPTGIFLLILTERKKRIANLANIFPGLLIGFAVFFIFEIYLGGDYKSIPYLYSGNNINKFVFHLSLWDLKRSIFMVVQTLRWVFPVGFFQSENINLRSINDVRLYLIPAAVGLIWLLIGKKHSDLRGRRYDCFLAICFGILVLGHIFFDGSGGRFGERYYFETAFVPIVLFSRFVVFMTRNAHRKLGKVAAIMIFSLVVASISLPNLLFYFPNTLSYYNNANAKRMDLYIQLERKNINDSLIIIQDTPEFYPSFYTRNDPDLNGNVFVNASMVLDENELSSFFPERKKYLYSRSSGAFEITQVQDFSSPR